MRYSSNISRCFKKKSEILPLHKRNSRNVPNIFRPIIASTPIISKIFEIMKIDFVKYLNVKNFFNCNYSAFREYIHV